MSPAAFLRDRALSVAVAIVCAIAIGSVVAVLGAGPDASVLAACIVLACAAVALGIDYGRRRAFYRDLEQALESSARHHAHVVRQRVRRGSEHEPRRR